MSWSAVVGLLPLPVVDWLLCQEVVVMERRGCTRFRDEALARLASEPPDAGFHGSRRRRWRDRVSRLARCLDELYAQDPEDSILGPILRLAFRALLPLVDPGWWRAHPKARLNAEARRQLRQFDKRRRQGARRGWAATGVGRLGLDGCVAAAIYARHGDWVALDLCARLLDHLDQALAGAGGGPPAFGTERRAALGMSPGAVLRTKTGGIAPGGGDLQRPLELYRCRHDAGAVDTAPGKEEDAWTSTAFCSGST